MIARTIYEISSCSYIREGSKIYIVLIFEKEKGIDLYMAPAHVSSRRIHRQCVSLSSHEAVYKHVIVQFLTTTANKINVWAMPPSLS